MYIYIYISISIMDAPNLDSFEAYLTVKPFSFFWPPRIVVIIPCKEFN